MHRWLEQWGRVVYRLRWGIVAAWAVLVVFGALGFGRLPELLSGGGWEVTGSQSERAGELAATAFEGRSASSLTLVVKDPTNETDSPAYAEKLRLMEGYLKRSEGVAGTFSLLDASPAVGQGLLGDDPHTSLAFVDMALSEDYLVNRMPDFQAEVREYAASIGVEAYLVGTAAFQGENSAQSQEGLARAELIVFPLIIVILLLVFRSVVSTITPLVVTIASVLAAMGIVYAVAAEVELSVFVTNSALMLGLGVGIDYSLFLVSRFKQELTRHPGRTADALAAAMATAGHTVLFSAITVIAALAALFVVPLPAIRAIAFGGIAVVFTAGAASLSLLPAVLGLLGERINRGAVPFLNRRNREGRASGWRKWTALMIRRPALFLVLSLGALAAMALPAGEMKLYSPDVRMLPADSEVRQGFELLTDAYGVGAASPVSVVLHADGGDLGTPDAVGKLAALQASLEAQPHVEAVTSALSFFPGMDAASASAMLSAEPGTLPSDVQRMIGRYLSVDRQTALMELRLDQYASGEGAKDTVRRLVDDILPAAELPERAAYSVGGETMNGMDVSNAIARSLLPALGIMLALIFAILVATFRSVLLPLKAIVLNLFSVAATYGLLVLVFADGYGADVFGIEANGYIIHFVPVLLLALLFGLSTDYEVFLVSRIKEAYDRTGENESSISEGMEETGPLITGAAVLMFAVFAGFAFSGVLPIQMLGFGMAVAIALDATIVRLLLVPVAMKLLGRLNWWFPGKSNRASSGRPAKIEAAQAVRPSGKLNEAGAE